MTAHAALASWHARCGPGRITWYGVRAGDLGRIEGLPGTECGLGSSEGLTLEIRLG